MSWAVIGAVTPALISAGGSIGAAAIARRGNKGGGGGFPLVKIPPFFEDKFYNPTQDYLFDFGKDILAGDLPDYYKPIGEFGSPEFESVLKNTLRDTTRNVEESAAARGVGRSGPTTSAVSKSVSDVSAQYRYQDLIRALGERSGLLRFGPGIIEGVRGAGLTNQGQKNTFNLAKAQLEMGQSVNAFDFGVNQQAAQPGISDYLGGGGSALETIFGDKSGGGGIMVPAGQDNFLSSAEFATQNKKRGTADTMLMLSELLKMFNQN